MGERRNLCTKIQIKAHKLVNSAIVKQPFRVITITLLSLLLPLSFLLLARLSCARFLLTLANNDSPQNTFFSIFLSTNPALLYFLVSVISISTLIQNLTGKITLLTNIDRSPWKILNRSMRLCAAWIFLCTLQICVGLGIEGSIAIGMDYSSFLGPKNRTLFSRVIFFVGLHETMLHWCRLVVKPVVDDTVLSDGLGAGEKWARRGAMAGGFGSLWYWRLRDEVESLVVVAEVKGEMLMEVGLGDFVGWWLYYLTVTVGMVRVVKGLIWVVMSLFRRRLNGRGYMVDHDDHDGGDDEEKLVI